MQTEPNPTPLFTQGAGAAGAAAGEVSRRALFVTAGLGVCAAGAVATPIALKYAEEQAAAALQRGINQGVQAGIDEGKNLAFASLDELESISLDAAIQVAEVAKAGIKYILQPLASLAATIGGDAIQVIVNGLDTLRGWASNFGYDNQQADQLSRLLHTWHNNLTNLPIQLATYANTDVDSAETYLKALKAQVDAAKAKIGQNGATPTPTK